MTFPSYTKGQVKECRFSDGCILAMVHDKAMVLLKTDRKSLYFHLPPFLLTYSEWKCDPLPLTVPLTANNAWFGALSITHEYSS